MFELEDIAIFGNRRWLDVVEHVWIEHVGSEWVFCLGVVFLSAILLRGHFEVRRRTLFGIAVIDIRFVLIESTAILLVLLHHYAAALLQKCVSFGQCFNFLL